jgi:Flp pilus assembly protein TadG
MDEPQGRASLIARLGAHRGGSPAVEFALLAPVLLLLILGGMEFGRLMWTQSALHLSVEQAARCGSVGLCTTASAPTFAAAVSPQLGFTSSNFTATNAACGFKVSASYSFAFIATNLFKLSPTLAAVSCVP